MAFLDFLFGEGAKTKTKPIYTAPGQTDILNQITGGVKQQLPSGLSYLQNILGGSPEFFEAFEAPARRGFEQKTLPTIAERFTGALGEGSQKSSAFGQQLGQAGRELEENLMSQRLGMQGNALNQLLQLLGPALSPRQEVIEYGRQPGFLENLAIGAAPGLGMAAGGPLVGGIGKGLSGILSLLKGIF
jgi:hypothetical protein